MKRRSVEYGLLCGLGIVAFVLLKALDAFERTYQLTRSYEAFDLDEIVLVVPVMALVFGLVAALRSRQLKAESAARRLAEAQARQVASTDPMTGLPNGPEVLRQVDERLAAGLRSGAFLIVDSTGFEQAVRRFGRDAGVAVLAETGRRIRRLVPQDALVGRLEGGLFAVLLPDADEPDAVDRTCTRLLRGFDAPAQCDGIATRVHVALAVVDITEAGLKAVELHRRAVVAMLQPRLAHQDNIAIYAPSMEEGWADRKLLVQRLRDAVARDELTCVYQPIVEIGSGRIVAFEVLSRWGRIDDAMIAPDVFIPLAEQSGLIDPLTENLLKRAIFVARQWPDDIRLSVNLSACQVQDPGLPLRIARMLMQNNFPAHRLELEVTETALVSNQHAARDVVAALRAMGIRVALDDFGIGFSNLGMLHDAAFDRIKIDKRFVMGMNAASRDRVIVETIIELSSKLGMEVTAEGVEDADALELLRTLGCASAQGYFFSRPIDGETTLGLVSSGWTRHKAQLRRRA